MLAQRAWERVHGADFDIARYEREVMPIVASLTPNALSRITGLSANHGTQVRKGVRRLHPMHWEKLFEFGAARAVARPP